jgi:serine/threonine protein phosphatase 1
MRTLAIGDIHGCLRALDAVLEAAAPRPDDLLITLGDYVDRGPDSAGVLDRLIGLHEAGRLVALRGNHDQMFLEARRSIDELWLAYGGWQTLASYDLAVPEAANLREEIPARHWQFLEEDCVDWFETDTHFFVHANVYPDLPLAEQPTYVLYWEKLTGPVAHVSGKVMVCGHTRQRSGLPLNLGTAVCIDTGIYEPDGWLTCLDVGSGRYWQANQLGKKRTGRLEEPEDD